VIILLKAVIIETVVQVTVTALLPTLVRLAAAALRETPQGACDYYTPGFYFQGFYQAPMYTNPPLIPSYSRTTKMLSDWLRRIVP
jgi:hypothetical protein